MERGRLRFLFNLCVKRDENLRIIRGLLSEGFDPNATDGYGNTPLHSAAESHQANIGVVRELIEAGADVNLVNSLGLTPLHLAVANRKAEMVDVLLQSGANINAATLMRRTALHYAINNISSELLRLYAANPNLVPGTPHTSITRMLLHREDIDVNAMDTNGVTPLVWALFKKHRAIARALFERGADPNIGAFYGESPLHLALYHREPCAPTVNLLLRHGADLHKLNRVNQSPIDLIVDGIRDRQSERFAGHFFKMVALHYNLDIDTILSIERDRELQKWLVFCIKEVRLLKSQVISGQLTMHDFILGCFNENQFDDPFLNIYKPVIDILMTGLYSAYFDDILNRIGKDELWDVLRHNFCLRRDENGVPQLRARFLDAFKFDQYRRFSRKELLNSIIRNSRLMQ